MLWWELIRACLCWGGGALEYGACCGGKWIGCVSAGEGGGAPEYEACCGGKWIECVSAGGEALGFKVNCVGN